ncbi:alpha/beta hydrolase [Microbacterium lacus]|uniref:Alpha/beta hydrolase n=1 Tax=Microbacterium lacus TaxID=415217 RepID=A0ABP4SZ22_9MICO
MSDKPILLFLHGVGTGDPDGHWKVRLSESLRSIGYPGLESVKVIAPRYAHALKRADEPESLPPLTGRPPTGDAARQNRREFERRIAAIEFRLGSQDRGPGLLGGDALVDFAVAVPFFEQARNYLKDPQIRAQVLNRILSKLPDHGRIVLVGHSLGSVIAADLVRRLPSGVEVVGMVTVGSPLASASFGVDKLRETLQEPPTNLAWWVSFWDWHDPVAARRGVSSAFPWMIDFQVRTRALGPVAPHQAVEYFSHDVVAEAVGFALFGSRSKELAPVETGVEVPLDTAESFALLALRYAHLIKMRLEGDKRDRYTGALRSVQAMLIDVLKAKREESGRPLPSAVARLSFDLSDPRAVALEPLPARHLSKEEAVVQLTVIASENVILPFEITVPPETRQKAIEELAAEMGLGSVFGTDLFSAAKAAQEALGGSRGVNWVKWGAIGAGAAAVVVATGGLALAAGAGLAGAAAITSALAAFGPGGMIGGLLTAGTLVTAGGGGIAFGLASPGTSAATMEAVVLRQLTAEILRKRQGLESDPSVWRNLVVMEMELRREHERFDEFSDDTAPSIKELKQKITTVERALAHMKALGLEPGGPIDEDASPAESARDPWYRRVVPNRP